MVDLPRVQNVLYLANNFRYGLHLKKLASSWKKQKWYIWSGASTKRYNAD